eukprot:Skav229523  [mRNA]  locus=scaffold887:112665:113618:+ [translate_table: standard]
MDAKTLRLLLEDAWLQHAAHTTNHRTMVDLHGMDGFLTKLDTLNMTPLDRARISALHSGAFMTNYEKSKFDPEKTAFCEICHCEDDRAHWLICPRFQHLRDRIPDWTMDLHTLPLCTQHHLLVPRLRCHVAWKSHLCSQQDQGFNFLVSPPTHGHHHLFIDGSCFTDEFPVLHLGAWAVVDATAGLAIAHGHLAGLVQTIDRAECVALAAALQWPSGTDLEVSIWSDSQSTVQMADFIQKHDLVPDTAANYDVWLQIQQLLQDRGALLTAFRWVPSHLPAQVAEDCFEDWIIHWNSVVDNNMAAATGFETADDILGT